MNRGSVIGLADQRLSDSHVEAAKALIAAGCRPVPPTSPRVRDLRSGELAVPGTFKDVLATGDVRMTTRFDV